MASAAEPVAAAPPQATGRWRDQARKALVAGVVIALALGTWLRIRLLIGGELDYDEGVYWQSLRALHAGHGLFGSVYSSQPPGFLLLMAPVAGLVSHSIVPARLEVLAVSLAGYAAASALVWRRVGAAGALLTLTLLAVDPVIVHESVTLQADSPATALGLVAVWLSDTATAARRRRRNALAVLTGATLALAVLVKLFAVVFVVAVAVIFIDSTRARLRWPDVADMVGGAAIGGIVMLAGLLLPFVGVWGDLWRQVVTGHLAAGVTIGGISATEMYREAPLMGLGAVGLAVAARLRPDEAIVGAALTVPPVAFLLLWRPIFPHHLVLAAIPLTVCAALLVAAARQIWTRVRPGAAAAAAAAVMALLVLSLQATPAPVQIERRTAAAIDRLVPAADLVITDDQYAVALADRSTPAQLVDTSFARILSGLVDTAAIEHIATDDHVVAVIFATGRLARLPGLRPWVARRFSHVATLPDGSVIYSR